jgi:S-DNA-T family DNA segregation ATPase FtsK/SpoIIIE
VTAYAVTDCGLHIRTPASLGIANLRKAVEKCELAFTAPIMRDGNRWRATIDLPHGITATDVIEKRPDTGHHFRRGAGAVHRRE